MISFAHQALTHLASAQAASDSIRAYITPAMLTISGLATLVCTFFIVVGGIRYMTSSGNPEKLFQAKTVLKNALIGLVIVLAAASLTGILHSAYSSSNNTANSKMPEIQVIEPIEKDDSTSGVITNAIIGIFRSVIKFVATPFLKTIDYFTSSTPLMAENQQVFNIWLATVALADVLFILVVALLGFHIMSFQSLGFEEMDIRQLLPQLALGFLLINTSIFAVDAVIGLSNAMIRALNSAFAGADIWQSLIAVTEKANGIGLAGLLIMVAFLILVIMLIVYYLGRLITLYVGAILSPLIVLLWLLPAFKDFAITALKTYLAAIFVLFVHVIIILLAAAIFVGVRNDTSAQPNSYIALLTGIATILALLKAQGFMQELSYASSTPKAARELSNQFIRGYSSIKNSAKTAQTSATKAVNVAKSSPTSKRSNNTNTNTNHNNTNILKSTTRQVEPKPSDKPPLRTGESKPAERINKS